MKLLQLSTGCAAVFVFSQLAAVAHPGHGPGEVPPTHLLTSAEHLGLALTSMVVFYCAVRALSWRKVRRES